MTVESTAPASGKLTTEEAKVVRSLAFYLQMTGSLISATGLFFCVTGNLLSWRSGAGMALFVIGVLVIRTANLFHQIGAAEKYEFTQLIEALTHLRNALRLLISSLFILLILALVWYNR